MENGSSVVCCKCDALVAKDRWQQHRDKWCPMLTDDDSSEEEEPKPKKDQQPPKTTQKDQKLILGDELD